MPCAPVAPVAPVFPVSPLPPAGNPKARFIVLSTLVVFVTVAGAPVARAVAETVMPVTEFTEAIARARDQFDELLVKEAKTSLRKKVNGYDVDEKKTVYVNGQDGKPVIKEQTTIKKHFQPDTSAIIFALTNKAPDEYKNRQSTELTGKGGKDLFASLTDEELESRIADLEKKIKQKEKLTSDIEDLTKQIEQQKALLEQQKTDLGKIGK